MPNCTKWKIFYIISTNYKTYFYILRFRKNFLVRYIKNIQTESLTSFEVIMKGKRISDKIFWWTSEKWLQLFVGLKVFIFIIT